MAVYIECLTDIAHLIAKDDLQRMVGIIDVFHHLRHLDVGSNELSGDIPIKLSHLLDCRLIVSADQCEGRIQIIMHRCPFPQELRIGHYRKSFITLLAGDLLNDFAYPLIRPGKYRAADRHDMKLILVLNRRADLLRHSVDIIQVQMSLFAAGRSHRNKGNLRILNRIIHICGCLERAFLMSLAHQFLNILLYDRRASAVNKLHLMLRYIHADHMMSQFCAAGRTHTAYISHSKYADSHFDKIPS